MTDQEKYEAILKSRAALQSEVDSGGVLDEAPVEDSSGATDVMAARQAQDQAALNASKVQKQSELSEIGNATTTAGALGANPYVAGAGVVLSTVGKIDDGVRANEQAKIDAYNKKIMAQRQAVRNNFA